MEQLAPHEKIYVDEAFLTDENHGTIGCHECHGGNPDDPDWKTAHADVKKDPTFPDATESCGGCHDDIADRNECNLHVNIAGIHKAIEERCDPDCEIYKKIQEGSQKHCSSCHSSCGQCHVSRPESVHGGLLEGHVFKKNPPMQQVCTACHGSRIGNEFLGLNGDIPCDIHNQKYLKCTKCHTGCEMHGQEKGCCKRYERKNRPKCLQCHENIYEDDAPNMETHETHRDLLSCQVCHSMPYKNCYSCHVAKDEQGNPFFETADSTIGFKIGFNPEQSESRPERFVTVRHVPADNHSFDYYCPKALTRFDSLPTWKLATPHNIRRQTPQNKSCNSCHGNEALFLIKTDVSPQELEANKNVIIPMEAIPAEM